VSQRVLVVNPALGAAGDMLLAALLAAGADPEAVRGALAPIGLADAVRLERTARAGLASWQLVPSEETGRLLLTREQLHEALDRAGLGEQGRSLARAALSFLEEAEARVHAGQHGLHELGSADTVLDLVGVAAAVEALQVTSAVIGTVGVGLAAADMAHGRYPIPAPAVLEIASRAGLTVEVRPGPEATTPTGAALLGALARFGGSISAAGLLRGVGYGAGARDDPDRANVLQVLVLEETPDQSPAEVDVLEVWLDDASGEDLGGFVEEALEEGALDAWLVAGHGKKGRLGVEVRVLCRPSQRDRLLDWIHRRTLSPGVRWRTQWRSELGTWSMTVDVDGVPCRVKVSPVGAKPEDDDVRVVARSLGLSLHEARARALVAWSARQAAGGALGKEGG